MLIFFKMADMKVKKDSVCNVDENGTQRKQKNCWTFSLAICLAQRSSPEVKLFEIVAAMPLICTTMFRAKVAPSLFTDARELKPCEPESVDFHM